MVEALISMFELKIQINPIKTIKQLDLEHFVWFWSFWFGSLWIDHLDVDNFDLDELKIRITQFNLNFNFQLELSLAIQLLICKSGNDWQFSLTFISIDTAFLKAHIVLKRKPSAFLIWVDRIQNL